MTAPTCFDDLSWRGLVHQTTDPAIGNLLDTSSVTVYGGFDPSADSLQLGNLLLLCNLRRLQEGGHRVIVLAGGGTGMIGDPGGKSEERNLLTREQLEHNLVKIRLQLERFIDLDAAGRRGRLVNNADWLGQVSILDFLRDTGKHFTVNQMVKKEMVRKRFEDESASISYTEFSYMLLQAHDFLHLHDTEGCTLQVGGSDQWGNIVTGVELIRKVRGAQAFGLTSPLVTTADGLKLGKSAGNAPMLDPAQTSPYAMWQFLFNAEDVKVGSYLRAFTWLSADAIAELDEATATAPGKRAAQRALANEVVGLVHGQEEAARCEHAASVLFSDGIRGLDESLLVDAVGDAPRAPLTPGLTVVDALVELGFAPSKGKARTLVEQGGVAVDGTKEADPERVLGLDDALHGRFHVLRKGKRELGLLDAALTRP